MEKKKKSFYEDEIDYNMKNGIEWGDKSYELGLWKECKKINEVGFKW